MSILIIYEIITLISIINQIIFIWNSVRQVIHLFLFMSICLVNKIDTLQKLPWPWQPWAWAWINNNQWHHIKRKERQWAYFNKTRLTICFMRHTTNYYVIILGPHRITPPTTLRSPFLSLSGEIDQVLNPESKLCVQRILVSSNPLYEYSNLFKLLINNFVGIG